MNIWTKISIVVLVVEAFLAAFPQLFSHYSPTTIDLTNRLAPPSIAHFLGTDTLGRDVFIRLLYAIRYSFTVASFSLVLSLSIGLLMGSLSAIVGGFADSMLSTLFNILYIIPGFFIAIALSILIGSGLTTTSIVIGLSLAPIFYRLCRSAAKEILTQPYIEAAKALGASTNWIIFRYVGKELFYIALTTAIFLLSDAIAFEASLSILGLGVQPPTPTLGNMIAEYKEYVFTSPHLLIYPVMVIATTIASLNTLANEVGRKLNVLMKNSLL
ncbi:ABC transporter permease [Ignisphaera sp. 4213-co]|uniref:ABC transporter permease n=1 Tax=Ignisphaera cupida TaxID=3050454 RepID=A0ABD4Z4J3_9CREN|nr:ABC transporter permease [Ignisphaera sp. 4213-co]MDK6028231.1 ABC transporter permease [Ignisphaera sp. 4213-co]